MFDSRLTPYTIAEYCAAMKRKELKVNHDYQRSAKVWPPAAKSFLIETILLGFPMPKICLYQITDVKTRQTVKEIVDGQQRSMTIMAFYEDEFSLDERAQPPEAAGKKYSELDEEHQHRFLDYALSVDIFVGATAEDIREVFRRMNSYTVPLNAEERRHAGFQGKLKWFIYRLTNKYSAMLRDVGAFSEKQLNRMQDAKLFAELVDALRNGIRTTNDKMLNRLYDDNDKEFPGVAAVGRLIGGAMEFVVGASDLHSTSLMKPHQLYALLLAVMHMQSPNDRLSSYYDFGSFKPTKPKLARAHENLTRLAAALEDPDSDPALEEFIEAGRERTNVADQRQARFVWCCQAIADELP